MSKRDAIPAIAADGAARAAADDGAWNLAARPATADGGGAAAAVPSKRAVRDASVPGEGVEGGGGDAIAAAAPKKKGTGT